MSRWLTCGICGQRQPVGIMSAQAWGVVNGASSVHHACPSCQKEHPDWRDQLQRLASSSG
jgi:hypothetical protein